MEWRDLFADRGLFNRSPYKLKVADIISTLI